MQSSIIAFIVGASISSVITDIRLDLGWRRLGLAVWEDDDGRRVRYLADPSGLDGMPEGTVVYFAPGYDQRVNWWAIDDAIRIRKCERVYL